MKIPESIQLLGTTIPVLDWHEQDRTSKSDRHSLGLAKLTHRRIYLAGFCRGEVVRPEIKEHTFFHELVHQVLSMAGYTEQNNDEQFVDLVAGLLHQALGPHMK